MPPLVTVSAALLSTNTRSKMGRNFLNAGPAMTPAAAARTLHLSRRQKERPTECGFLYAPSVWSLFRFLNLWVYIFHKIWIIFSHYFFFKLFNFILELLFSHQILSDSLLPHELQHTRLLCPPLSLCFLRSLSTELVIRSNHLIL